VSLSLSACQSYGCQPGSSTPADAARDRKAFNKVLRANPAFKGITAMAVHGHAVDVVVADGIEWNCLVPTDHVDKCVPVFKLLDAWGATFAKLHPNEFNRDVVLIEARDPHGRSLVPVSSHECATL
jgi:hypothetical protein